MRLPNGHVVCLLKSRIDSNCRELIDRIGTTLGKLAVGFSTQTLVIYRINAFPSRLCPCIAETTAAPNQSKARIERLKLLRCRSRYWLMLSCQFARHRFMNSLRHPQIAKTETDRLKRWQRDCRIVMQCSNLHPLRTAQLPCFQ